MEKQLIILASVVALASFVFAAWEGIKLYHNGKRLKMLYRLRDDFDKLSEMERKLQMDMIDREYPLR